MQLTKMVLSPPYLGCCAQMRRSDSQCGENRTGSYGFTMTTRNGNNVQSYIRSSDDIGQFRKPPTGGTGVATVWKIRSLALSRDRQFLYIVNPGSNDLTVFRLTNTSVHLTDARRLRTLPVSVAEWNGTIYVLNRNGAAAGIESHHSGIRSLDLGNLSPSRSTIALRDTDTNASQIASVPMDSGCRHRARINQLM